MTSLQGPRSNFVIKLGMEKDKAFGLLKLHNPSYSRFVTIHSRYRKRRQTTTEDEQHLMPIEELAIQLQRSAKNSNVIFRSQRI